MATTYYQIIMRTWLLLTTKMFVRI